MTLKEQIITDIDDVFLDYDDFATYHMINGEKILCVVDDERLIKRQDAAAQGTYLGEKLIFVKQSDLGGRPAVDSRMEFDGKPLYVRSVAGTDDLLEIRLGATKT